MAEIQDLLLVSVSRLEAYLNVREEDIAFQQDSALLVLPGMVVLYAMLVDAGLARLFFTNMLGKSYNHKHGRRQPSSCIRKASESVGSWLWLRYPSWHMPDLGLEVIRKSTFGDSNSIAYRLSEY